jgi:hypothetical protein
MTDSAAPPRPRQVTIAAWLIMLGSVLVVLTVFERVSGLQSLDTQRAVEKFLAEPPGDGLGLGVQGVIDILRVLAMVAGGCAAAAGVLGFHVLQRSRGARIGLSVLALPLFVAGMAAGGFMSSVVAAASVMLWFQPARDWFDGVTRAPRAEPRTEPRTPPKAEPEPERPSTAYPPPRERVGASVPSGPRAYPGFGAPPAPDASTADRAAAPGWPTTPASAPAAAGARPGPVVAACVLTWVMSLLAVLMMLVSIALLVSDAGRVYDEVVRQNPGLAGQGVSQDVLVQATYVLGGVAIVWSLVAIALAVLVFRRVAWARPLLMASAGMAGLLCLLAVAVGQLLVLVPLAACVAAVALLARPEVRTWFRP